LSAEVARKTSLEQRAITVITTSSALATLLFGLTALATRETQTYHLDDEARYALVVALSLFLSAALTALATNAPLFYDEVKVDQLRQVVSERWNDPESTAEQQVAFTRLKVLADARAKNGRKAWGLEAALGCEVLAVTAVAVAVGFILLG